MEAEARYANLKELVSTMPDFGGRGSPAPKDAKTLEWLGRMFALVEDMGDAMEAITLKSAADSLGSVLHERSSAQIRNILYRALSRAELKAPVSARGAFIAPGNAYDAVAAIGSILESAERDVMIVDPYLTDNALSTYAIFAKESVSVLLLGGEGRVKSTLRPAAEAWIKQYGKQRPLALRLADPSSLHDRLIIIDRQTVWDLTQSLNKFADRSPATLVRADPELAAMKVEAYHSIFESAELILAS